MNTVREWILLWEYLFKYASAVKVLNKHVYQFLFLDFDDFEVFRDVAHRFMFPFCYSTTVVCEYEITVDFFELCRRISAKFGTSFVKFSKRK